MNEQISICIVVFSSLILFTTGTIRYDMVALVALLTCVFAGLVPAAEAFDGFSNTAVVTVAAVLVISRGLQNAGVVNQLAWFTARIGDKPATHVLVLTSLTSILSAFINNVGALALMMPVAIDLARKHERSPSFLLMPMAFGSLLGGMTTLIGTPSNLIISTFRTRYSDSGFGMFDFSPAGVGAMVAGVAFISLIGWRLIPKRESQHGQALFEIGKYLVDVIVTDNSSIVGRRFSDFVVKYPDIDFVALVRGQRFFDLRNRYLKIKSGDILLTKTDPADLQALVEECSLKISGDKPHKLESAEMSIVEAVVSTGSVVVGRSVKSLQLRLRYGANMIALSRRHKTVANRLKDMKLKVGDVLMLQIPEESVRDVLGNLKLLPLARRDIPFGQNRRLLVSLTSFAAAIAIAAMGWVPTAVAFATTALAFVLVGIVPVRELYDQIDWPIIVLLGAMIPVGGAIESSGAASALSVGLVDLHSISGPVVMLILLMLITMFLSDILNNAATAIVMAPIAIGLAQNLGVSPDPYLLGVAIASSCAFLTPIGHQSNTLVMGPGGYRFGDYFRLGIWVEIIVLGASVPLLLWFWPFSPNQP